VEDDCLRSDGIEEIAVVGYEEDARSEWREGEEVVFEPDYGGDVEVIRRFV